MTDRAYKKEIIPDVCKFVLSTCFLTGKDVWMSRNYFIT